MLQVDMKNWTIIKNELTTLDEHDYTLLTEDLFQIKKDKITIDVGWYDGIQRYQILLIVDSNWDEPTIKINCKTRDQSLRAVELCIKHYEAITGE